MRVKFGDGRTPRLGFLIAAMTWAGLALPAAAASADLGDAVEGHRLAEVWCTNCHIVDRATSIGTSTGAPPFAAVARMRAVTPLSLRVFLQSPHERMPDLHLSRAEMDDLITYILSLREP
jgi:mono/diheme cytochrome c family protein